MAAAEAELEALLESSLVSGRPAKRAKRNQPADKASAEVCYTFLFSTTFVDHL